MLIADLYRRCRGILRVRRLALRGAAIGDGAVIGDSVEVRCGFADGHRGRIAAGPHNHWERGVVLNAHGGSIALGAYVYLGPYTVIYGHGGVTVGDNCLIGPHCCILSSNHTVPPFGTDVRSQPDVLLPTRIGQDVWLGAGVTVLGGVVLGDGCVIGAGAVVTRDIPPGAIAHGVPAVVRGRRENSPAA